MELSDERLAEIRKLDGTDGKFVGVLIFCFLYLKTTKDYLIIRNQ